jgi:hypothetical protein
MSDSDDKVIIGSNSKENFCMKYDTNCLPYAPAGRHMAPKAEGCPYAYGGGGFCSNGHGRDTTRITIHLAFWQFSDNVILIMFGTS